MTSIVWYFFIVWQELKWSLCFADQIMHPVDLWTIFLVVLSLNPRISLTVNQTDARWGEIGVEARFNATSEEKATEIPRIKHELHIGGFFDKDSRNGAGALSAAMMAVEEINQDSLYLKDYQVVLHHKSTKVGIIFILLFQFSGRAGENHCGLI